MFGANDLKSAIRELDDTTNTLYRFTRIISSNRQLVEDKSPKKALKLARALRQVRGFARNLYLAISQGWRAGCHSQHEAKLFLEDRVDTAAGILKQARKDSFAPVLIFQLIFAASISQGQTLWHEAVVQVLKANSDNDPDPPLASQASRSPQVVLIVPQSTLKGPEVTFVHDICAAIEATRCGNEQVAFVLTGNQQFGTIATNEKTLISYHQADKTTLKALLLSDNKPNHHGTLLPLRLRMLLALRLASNLLQLLQTQWLQSAWSKDVIYFLLRPTGGASNASRNQLYIDFSRPFVSLTFDDSSASAPTQQNVDPKVALLELGILLLEIWHGTTLETQFSLKEAPGGYYERLALALRWLDDMKDPLPELYDKAASHCIRGMIGGETRFREWEDIDFWGAVCGDIIEPLSKNCKQWR